MDPLQLLNIAAGGAVLVVCLVVIVKVLWSDRRADRRLDNYTRSLEARIAQLEAWKDAATSALVAAGVPLPTVVAVPVPALDRS